MDLRIYQGDGIQECSYEFQKGLNSLVYQLATGGGKTVIFTEITYRFLQRNSTDPVVIVVHRIELLRQTRIKLFKEYDIAACEVVAGMKKLPEARVYLCMVESLNKRIFQIKKPGLLILDECHIAVHNKIIDKFQAKLVLGFSGSPISSNKKEPLNKRYQGIVVGPQINQLIADRYLSQNITYAPNTGVDRNNLIVKGDDFDEVEMAKEFSKPRYVINTVDGYRRWGLGTKTIIFNVNIEHSRTVAAEFVRQGFNCRYLDTNCSPDERTKTLEWFSSTEDAILCNVGILTAGYDEPTIRTVIVNKATNSLAHWLQMCGRGGRIIDAILAKLLDVPEKYHFTIVDMGKNAITLGDWNDDRDWKDIFDNPPKKSKNSVAPCKNCPNCEAILFAGALVCKYCNFIFPPKIPSTEELLSDYIILTKNIDVQKIIQESEKHKEYHSFFKIVREHTYLFKRTKQQVSHEIFEFVLNGVYTDCKKWCHLNGKKFNQWHKTLCLTELQNLLKYEYRVLQEDHKS